MNNETNDENLKSKLSRFENHLETPFVAGELIEWVHAAERVFADVLPALRTQINSRHPKLIEEIVEQDPGQLSCAEHFQGEDQKLLKEAERQSKVVSLLASRGDELEPDEALTSEVVGSIVDEGLELVIRIRKQEAAIDTWLMEAFDRDRGVAD